MQITSDPENPDRHVAFGIFCFLCRRGNRVKSNVGEENHACAARNARPPERPELSLVGRDKRVPVGRSSGWMAQKICGDNRDEREHSSNFHEHNCRIEVGRLANTEHENRRDNCNHQISRQIYDSASMREGEWIDAGLLEGWSDCRESNPDTLVEHERHPRRRGQRRRNLDSKTLK